MNTLPATIDAEKRARMFENFEKQQVMRLFNARLIRVEAGQVQIEFPYQKSLTQQNGYIHAGVLSTVMDSACGYAAFSLMTPGCGVLSIEFKVNFLSPAQGDTFVATGKVIRAGRTITVCAGEVMAVQNETRKLAAVMQATMMTVEQRND